MSQKQYNTVADVLTELLRREEKTDILSELDVLEKTFNRWVKGENQPDAGSRKMLYKYLESRHPDLHDALKQITINKQTKKKETTNDCNKAKLKQMSFPPGYMSYDIGFALKNCFLDITSFNYLFATHIEHKNDHIGSRQLIEECTGLKTSVEQCDWIKKHDYNIHLLAQLGISQNFWIDNIHYLKENDEIKVPTNVFDMPKRLFVKMINECLYQKSGVHQQITLQEVYKALKYVERRSGIDDSVYIGSCIAENNTITQRGREIEHEDVFTLFQFSSDCNGVYQTIIDEYVDFEFLHEGLQQQSFGIVDKYSILVRLTDMGCDYIKWYEDNELHMI